MPKQHNDKKFMIAVSSSIVVCLMLGIILWFLFYGSFDLNNFSRSNNFVFRYLPRPIKVQYCKVAMMQSRIRWSSYGKNILVKQFLAHYPTASYSKELTFSSDADADLFCWTIVYGRYLLTMRLPFKHNLTQTDIGSCEDPVFDHLGDAYLRINKNSDALRAWRQAVKLSTKRHAKLKVKILRKIKMEMADH